MDSVLAMPGIALIREDTFRAVASLKSDIGDRTAQEKARLIENYFVNDDTGGNPVRAVARDLFTSQTAFTGPGAASLRFLFDVLVSRLVSERDIDFSAHDFNDSAKLAALVRKTYIAELGSELSSTSYASAPEDEPPSVWDRALEMPLAELELGRRPRQALEVIRLKTDRMADLLLDRLGRRTTSAIVSQLRQRYVGRAITEAQVSEVGKQVAGDRWPGLVGWLHTAELPGFAVSNGHVLVAEDDQTGWPSHITNFHVRNNEKSAGFVAFGLSRRTGAVAINYEFDPVRIPAESSVEIGLESRIEPNELFVKPYLSLNRRPLYVDLDHGLDGSHAISEAFVGVRASDWKPLEVGLVVDDLDDGFGVIGATAAGQEATDESAIRPATDHGLPVYRPSRRGWTSALWRDGFEAHADALSLTGKLLELFVDRQSPGPADQWSRQELTSAWGRYRRTVVRISAGDGSRKVVFACDIPVRGQWRLEYHVPDITIRPPTASAGAEVVVGPLQDANDERGSYHLRLVAGTVDVEVDLDQPIGPPGWKFVGDFPLPRGQASVIVSNRSTGRNVVADAIRWRLPDGRDGSRR